MAVKEWWPVDKIILAFGEDAQDLALRQGVVGLLTMYSMPIVSRGHLFEVKAKRITSMPEDEFLRQVMIPETRKIARVEPVTSATHK